MKDANFRVVWHESMKGVNMSFDNLTVAWQITDTLLNNLNLLLNHPKFDTAFELVIENISKMINLRRNFMFNAASVLILKGRQTKRSNSRNRQQ